MLNREVVKASTVAFIASFCTLVIELVAGRIMAPYVGVSLYTWTSIIGVVLAGISLGAYLGGLLADRLPSYGTLGVLLALSGLSALTIAPLADVVGDGSFLKELVTDAYGFEVSLMVRILVITTTVFFVPALILGMISPVVVKLTVKNLDKTGNVVGKIYAFSTLGSILGTFATGFFLIEWLGTRTILYGVAAVLMLSAPIFGGVFAGSPNRRKVVAASLILLVIVLGGLITFRDLVARPLTLTEYDHDKGYYQDYPESYRKTIFFKESDYYTIKVVEEWDSYHHVPIRTLLLDHLVHSYTHPTDPLFLKYHYLKIYDELVAWQMEERPRDKFLFIGGGGYTLPRCFDTKYPDARIDVVEIDPWVTHVAEKFLGIDKTKVRTFNMDARWYVMNCKEQYDFIFGDAFNDLSIPYHLTTKEFDEQLKRILKPDGLLMALVIDNVRAGLFLPCYIRTLQEVFPPDNVILITSSTGDPDEIEHDTCIVVASQKHIDLDSFDAFLDRLAKEREDGVRYSNVVSRERLARYLRERKVKPFVLTDDHVPVDNLVAPMFDQRFRFRKE